ncbi:ionotropic receptor 75a-like [Colias croceus]|uniref:ionotropic receptor 75a-like n=1 Tax=Colias crocea TaxID=72248 RepID=UPI001E27CD8E|nr:ionotropic receptor 75a-like [Colias croceus]
MLFEATAMAFKYKVVGSIIIFTCCTKFDAVKLVRTFNNFDIQTTISCDPTTFKYTHKHRLQGVLFIPVNNELNMVPLEYFSIWYKWVIISDTLPEKLHTVRYDADIILMKPFNNTIQNELSAELGTVTLEDVFIHPQNGATIHPWAYYNNRVLQVVYERERILRRMNLQLYTLKIATPLGLYSNDTYDGSFKDYLQDMSMPERDSGIRSTYITSSIIIERLNATELLIPTQLWSTEVSNSSMLLQLHYGSADLAGGALRIMHSRIKKLDYAMNVWPFHVGFTYLAERESSNNMFMAPFTVMVWYCSLALFAILLIAQRVTAKSSMEKEGAYIAVLATFLQQDASAVPCGISGRWTFLVLSISAMLIHAYYTSAIVSALVSTGRSGPDSLRSLGDSRYSIASEDYDYMRYLMFDVPTNWSDLEYLKRKKMTNDFYKDMKEGVKLIQTGQTAYHTEYNQLYPHLRTFTDDQLCKLQYVDTVPEILSWLTTTKRGQWTDIIKSTGAWLHETGLAKRIVSRIRIRPPPCRAALLAERVNIHDIAPLLVLTFSVVVLAVIILAIEVLFAKLNKKTVDLEVEVEDSMQ